ncbi:MAG: hypothetical protein ACTH7C_13420, partial [Cobetia marina]
MTAIRRGTDTANGSGDSQQCAADACVTAGGRRRVWPCEGQEAMNQKKAATPKDGRNINILVEPS